MHDNSSIILLDTNEEEGIPEENKKSNSALERNFDSLIKIDKKNKESQVRCDSIFLIVKIMVNLSIKLIAWAIT